MPAHLDIKEKKHESGSKKLQQKIRKAKKEIQKANTAVLQEKKK